MKYYIYPAGGNAQYIKHNLEILCSMDSLRGGGDLSPR